jgi:hypothetical protein
VEWPKKPPRMIRMIEEIIEYMQKRVNEIQENMDT